MPTAVPDAPAPLVGCTPLFDAAATREADRRATAEYAVPSILLMERAGACSAQGILARHPDTRAATVLVGSGNNGGDGMVVARHLAAAGWAVRVMSADGAAPSTPDGATMSAMAAAVGIPVTAFHTAAPRGGVLVDALLGTGTRGAPRPPMDAMVAWTEGWEGPVVALDVPTGVDADTGEVAGTAILADLTFTYHADKPGLRIAPGAHRAGEVEVVDIGIPAAVRSHPVAWLAAAGAAAAIPPKARAGEKYGAGSVLVVAGAPGLTGAGVLASMASLRAGAGLTVAAVPATVQPLMAPLMLEVMCAPVPDDDGHLCAASVEAVVREAGRASSLAVGPGLGRAEATTTAVLDILRRVALPAVVDADGLWHLRAQPDAPRHRDAPTVLTPHAGEAARLLGWERADVDARRMAAARELASRTGAVVVLKGPGTLIADPQGTLVVAAGGSPSLSTAGSGDVLTGIIAAGLSKGMAPLDAAVAGVALHAQAAVEANAGDGMIAGDLLTALPAARRRTT